MLPFVDELYFLCFWIFSLNFPTTTTTKHNSNFDKLTNITTKRITATTNKNSINVKQQQKTTLTSTSTFKLTITTNVLRLLIKSQLKIKNNESL